MDLIYGKWRANERNGLAIANGGWGLSRRRGGAEARRGQQKHFWAGRRPPDAPCFLLFLPPCLSRLSVRHSCLRSDGLNSHSEGAIQSQTNRQACLPVRMDQKRQLGFPSSAQSSAVNPENFVNPVILSKQPSRKFCKSCLKRFVLCVLGAQREVIFGSCKTMTFRCVSRSRQTCSLTL